MDTNTTPYLVVISGEHSAIYNRKYELISENASQELIAFVLSNYTQRQDDFRLFHSHQQPTWMSDTTRQAAVSYFCYNDGVNARTIANIPAN